MKKALLFLCLTVGLCLFSIAFWPSRTLTFSEIPIRSDERIDALISDRTALPSDLLSVTACGETLPRDENSDTWYTPVLTDAVTLTVPHPWQLVRTSQGNCGEQRVVLYSGMFYTECIVVETGLPVLSVDLRRFDLEPRNIDTNRIAAVLHTFSLSDNGTLDFQSDNIEIKRRSGSSLAYPKKSYTIFLFDSSRVKTADSLLKLPADRKFVLNSLYEDDSKIRDALAYRLYSEMEPENSLQFTYAELVINGKYLGLYGVHQTGTEYALHTSENDVIYKIQDHLGVDDFLTRQQLPRHEISYGNDPNSTALSRFFEPLLKESDTFPTIYDLDSFVHYAIQMEILACQDTTLKNMIITYLAEEDVYRLTAWDNDISFGNNWDINAAQNVVPDMDLVSSRFLKSDEELLAPLSILYNGCDVFRESVCTEYRKLRETVFTDEFLLEQAAALYDTLTDCGARARDAARWPDSAISEDNSFMETFIPARMAFLDREFAPAN